MADAERYYHFQWTLRAQPEALWPWVANTNRFNRDTKLPEMQRLAAPGERLPNGQQRLAMRRLGIELRWVEMPFEWVQPHRFSVERHYTSGPIAAFRSQLTLTPLPGEGTRLSYEIWARPRNLLGQLAIPVQVLLLSAPIFGQVFQRYDQSIAPTPTPILPPSRVSMAPGGLERLNQGSAQLLDQGLDPTLIDHLTQTLAQGDDLDVARLQPYVLADQWEASRRDVLALCLHATRAGLLDLQWDVICPLCRNPRESQSTLSSMKTRVHCEACNIDYSANFDRSVALTFRPNPTIREPQVGEYCLGSPTRTPHIVAQQYLVPGETRQVPLTLAPGRYRVRAMELAGGQFLSVQPDGSAVARFRATHSGWPHAEPEVAPAVEVTFENATDAPQLFILEEMVWGNQAATAADVTTLQLFRDLFSGEVLRRDERIEVGSLTVVFTDLRGSTQLYREIGDAPAFGRVMGHFDILREAIQAEDGALVKTIGDAVMAVFRQPVAAIRALAAAQRALANDGGLPLSLKAGVHSGPCIAVTLNDRLDYFGSTVNLAARLEGLSTGDDIVVSDAVRRDPQVAALLQAGTLQATPFMAPLKGFDNERFALWRIAQLPLPHPQPKPVAEGRSHL